MKIYAPVKTANGIYASVVFKNGVGETDDEHLLKWFKSHGYTLEEINVIKENNPIDTTIDFKAMTPLELRDYMIQHGYSAKIGGTRNKEKLLDILRAEEHLDI